MCIACGKPSGRKVDLCSPCALTLRPVDHPCLTCGLPLPPGDHESPVCGACLNRKWRMARTVSAFGYSDTVAPLITHFKYHAGLQHGRVLGNLLATRLAEDYRRTPLPEVLIPVPLHPARLRERGFNQALLLARQLGQALDIPVAVDCVQRLRQTPAQQGLPATERRRNLRGAFALRPDGGLEKSQSVALVDDVVTTMSTMNELARVLRAAGISGIHAWCLARA